MTDGVGRAIARFAPRTVDEQAASFARAVVGAANPPNAARAKALLFATSRLGAFGLRCGLELSPEVLLHPSVVERFCQTGSGDMAQATRRTLRTNLRHVAARVRPAGAGPRALSRERAKAPYSPAQIAAYLALCDAQRSEARRHHAGALVCLGAGAGLMGMDLRELRGGGVVMRSGGVLVSVGGRRARVVPVRGEFHERLLAAAAFEGDGYVIGGIEPHRRNVTTPLTSSLAGGRDLPRLDLGRLRSTWLRSCAQDLGLKGFLDAAGIVCSQRLGDIVAHLEALDEESQVRLLGAAS